MSCRAPFHVVVFFDFPSLSAVMRLLPLPMKGVRFHFTERPTYRQRIGVSTVQDDTIALTSPSRSDDIVELRIYKNDAPLLECRIEEPNRRSYRAFLLTLGRIADPKVLYCVTIHDPAEQQLSLFMENGAVGATERKVGIPSADQTVKRFGFLANGRIRIRRSQQLDHCLSRRLCESFFSLFARAFLWAHLRRRCDCHRNKRYQAEQWRSTNASHNGDVRGSTAMAMPF